MLLFIMNLSIKIYVIVFYPELFIINMIVYFTSALGLQ